MQSFCDRRPLLLHHCVVQSNVGEFLDKAWPTDAKRESQVKEDLFAEGESQDYMVLWLTFV
jgi:hypothetical protein